MQRPLAFLALLLAAALAGCGQAASSAEDFEGNERAVADAVEEFQDAGESGEAERICSEILAEPLAQRLERGATSCADEVTRALDDTDDVELTVQDVTIAGAEARARVDNEGVVRTMLLVRERGGWRISDLGG